MIKRKLRYNVKTDLTEQAYLPHSWTIALVNEPREIDRIRERIFFQLAPIDDFHTNYSSSIPGTNGLVCEIFSFLSKRGDFTNSSKIYDSPDFKKDRDLRDVSESKLENYVQRVLLK